MDSRLWPFGEIQEVLILADDNAFFTFGVPANLAIGSVAQLQIEDMLAIESPAANPLGKSTGKLVIDDEFHGVRRTTWSVWWAAYSRAARMSSRSRNG